MKFNIMVGGEHRAEVTINLDGKGAFTGTIISPEFGTGEIQQGRQTGLILTGVVRLDGHEADFTASLDETGITGKLRLGWFFSETFTGQRAS